MKSVFDLPDVLEVKDIQHFLGIGRSQAYQLVKSNSFHAVKVGKRILVPKKAFLNWFEGCNMSAGHVETKL
ncbi:helix-turn-helix domain-containing protein [Mesobacillus foraminis]|uniref:helix-turn-helix domain-containing protein n=1 Tax=Mesobacillus foraminis TaxID=279826 RepID=UPI001BE88C35|nr:helix-turn-helix domain-containing protein [Mesobacillus foraminis]MBT2755894.1 helix-turn-helix domain-containing protein [Mesobacillus foraminis]